MKISGFDPVKNSGGIKKSGKAAPSGNFADVLASSEAADTVPSSAVGDVAATSALNNLLALQEISEEDVQRRKLVQQGKGLLDVLENLRRQLLIGTLPPRLLYDLNRQLSIKRQLVNDPVLMALIEDIELRAAVELAKLESAMERSHSAPRPENA